jgi:hypothetical protein
MNAKPINELGYIKVEVLQEWLNSFVAKTDPRSSTSAGTAITQFLAEYQKPKQPGDVWCLHDWPHDHEIHVWRGACFKCGRAYSGPTSSSNCYTCELTRPT